MATAGESGAADTEAPSPEQLLAWGIPASRVDRRHRDLAALGVTIQGLAAQSLADLQALIAVGEQATKADKFDAGVIKDGATKALLKAGGGQQGAGNAGAVAVGRVRTVLCIRGRKQALEYSMLAPDNIIDLTQLEKACNIKIEACDFAAPADAHQAPQYKPNFQPCTNLTPTITPGQAVWVKASADKGAPRRRWHWLKSLASMAAVNMALKPAPSAQEVAGKLLWPLLQLAIEMRRVGLHMRRTMLHIQARFKGVPKREIGTH